MAAVAALALAGCGGGGGAPATAARPKPAPKEQLDMFLPREMIRTGMTVSIRGVTANRRPAKVVLEADPYPFHDFRKVDARTAGRRGRYVFHVKPTRNTRYRLVSPDGRQATSGPRTVYVFPKSDESASWVQAGVVDFSVTIHVPAALRYRPTREYFYVRQPGTDTLHLKGHGTVRRGSKTTLVARVRLNVGTSNSFRWVSCYRRSPAIGMGKSSRVRECGADSLSWRGVHDGALDF